MKLTTFAAVAGALATPLALAAPASATTGTGSAYGVTAQGLVAIPQTPAVTATADKSLIHLPANPLIDVKILHVTAKPAYARASVTDLSVAKAALTAHLVTATCKNGNGVSHLADAQIAGHRLAVDAAPNSAISVPVQGLGAVAVTLNKQVNNPDGSLTVTAIEVRLANAQTISISSATCNAADTPTQPPGPTPPPGQPTGKPIPSPTGPTTPPSQAPKPTPVPSNLPVTG
ncbi:choice-of-anchor P family protein [Actinoallomurus purpureus]|uniref:choice-of-anchor P family protein n=1 Tax=Actinoallomurus purpureus TaxID=478114 RepID=UPI002093D8AA|nr:choice-of-anchor P family protein [Actinoallomurus purpureus]MCO6010184.1 choice-of-anchor P family protein [Actinoallomurus purpureus]